MKDSKNTEVISLELLVNSVVMQTYPVQRTHVRIMKIMPLAHDVLQSMKKNKRLTPFEQQGDTYLFWCFVEIDGLHRIRVRFLFGQLTVNKLQVACGYHERDFQEWAQKAYLRGWFDFLDVRALPITRLTGSPVTPLSTIEDSDAA